MAEVNPAREAAFASLLKMKCGKYTNIEVSTTLKRQKDMSKSDRALYTALVYGTVERLITLDYIISQYSKTPIEKLDEEALCALRMGIYQLTYMYRIPDHAAVSESVSLCPRRVSGYVNAVLRSYIRAGKSFKMPSGDDIIEYISIAYSVPRELCSLFCLWYGNRECENIFKAFFAPEKTSLRVNTLKISAADAAKKLNAEISDVAPDVLTVSSFDCVMEGIESGLWFVQDEASALCAHVLGAERGETVADCCAAPGGKSFAAAIDMKNEGHIHSFDIHDNKLSLINDGAKRLGIDIIETSMRDAREPELSLIGKCDRVLCDAPCSGFGIIGKKPDIKYKGTDAIIRLPKIQYEVLCGASCYVKRGGVLVYSTCTLNPQENSAVCNRFLSEHGEYSLMPFEVCGKECDGMMTMLPSKHGTDGFFICKMVKSL